MIDFWYLKSITSRLTCQAHFAPLKSMKATRPRKTANKPFWQAGVQRFSSTQSTPRVVIPPPSHTQKALSAGCENRNFDRNEKRSRSPAGPRRLRTATRMSASLFRRLSAFFGSTPGQDPKAAKYAVLIPGPGMFVNVQYVSRVVIPPRSKRPLFRRVCPCVRSFSESRVCTHFRL